MAPSPPVIDTVASDDTINAAEQTSVISGSGEAHASVRLSLASNIRTAQVDGTAVFGIHGTGSWSYTLTADDISAMGEGAETISAPKPTPPVTPAPHRPATLQ